MPEAVRGAVTVLRELKRAGRDDLVLSLYRALALSLSRERPGLGQAFGDALAAFSEDSGGRALPDGDVVTHFLLYLVTL